MDASPFHLLVESILSLLIDYLEVALVESWPAMADGEYFCCFGLYLMLVRVPDGVIDGSCSWMTARKWSVSVIAWCGSCRLAARKSTFRGQWSYQRVDRRQRHPRRHDNHERPCSQWNRRDWEEGTGEDLEKRHSAGKGDSVDNRQGRRWWMPSKRHERSRNYLDLR